MKSKIFTLMFGLLISASSFAQDHHWPLTADANDAVGTAHGTNTGVTFADDAERGPVAVFNGTDASIALPSVLKDGSSEVTISTWFKSETPGELWRRLYTLGTTNAQREFLEVLPDGHYHDMCVFSFAPATSVERRIPHNVKGSVWYHSVLVISHTYMKIYVDGVQVADMPLTKELGLVDDNQNILGNGTWGANYFKGSMSDFRIYNEALSEGEVAQLYVTTDKSPVSFGAAKIADEETSATLAFLSTVDGNVYYTVGAETDPTPLTSAIKADVNATTVALTANAAAVNVAGDLTAATRYKVFVAFEDGSGTMQDSLVLNIKTDASKDGFYHWPLSANVDDVEGGLNGTNNNVIFVNDADKGDVAYFNGTDATVDLPSVINGMDEVTVSVWMKMEEAIKWARLYSFGNGDPRNLFEVVPNGHTYDGIDNFTFIVKEDIPAYTFGSYLGYAFEDSTETNLVVDTWYHVAAVISKDRMKTYVNNVQVFDVPAPKDFGNINDTKNMLGGGTWGTHFKGWMSDLQIYTKALTAQEVENLYNPTGIVDINTMLDGNVYPNPAQGNVTFSAKDFQTIEMFSITGQSVLKLDAREDVTVNADRFKSGIYIVKFTNGDVSVSKKLVIK